MKEWVTLFNLLFLYALAKENQSMISVDIGSKMPMMVANQSANVFDHTVSSYLEHLPDGISVEIVTGALTYDGDGHPMILVNPAQIFLLAALLTEHDERYHKDWPGHATITPNSETETQPEDGHILASSIDGKLSGHVDPADEEDLEQMMDQPPKLVRVRRAFFHKKKRTRKWPQGDIPYVFDSKISDYSKKVAIQSMTHIMDKVPCIKFSPVTKGISNYVLITSQATGCFTKALGFKNGENLMNVGQGCDFSAAVHEWGHILGAIHTQNRPDRDQYIDVNWDNIEEGRAGLFKKSKFPLESSDVEYDYNSTMHYPSHAFAKDLSQAVLRVKAPNKFKLQMFGHNAAGLSVLDVKSFRDWYGCPETNSEEKEEDKDQDIEDVGSECLLSPWSRWSRCKKGKRAKFRSVINNGGTCPEYELDQLMQYEPCYSRPKKRPKTRKSRAAGKHVESGEGSIAEARMNKTVTVSAGQPIVLVVSNPNNLPVRWYHNDVEIVPGDKDYLITRSAVDRLTVVKSGQEYDGHRFAAKISMSQSELRIMWDIYFEKTD